MPDGSEIDALKAALAAVETRAANAEAQVSDAEAQIAALKLMIEKLRHALFGQRSERKQRLLDQMELQLDELEASATEDELAAEQAAAGSTASSAAMRSPVATSGLDAAFSSIRNIDCGRAHGVETVIFSDLAVGPDGTFSRGQSGARIQGGFHGPGHAEAAGVFEQSDIVGTFGATRQ